MCPYFISSIHLNPRILEETAGGLPMNPLLEQEPLMNQEPLLDQEPLLEQEPYPAPANFH